MENQCHKCHRRECHLIITDELSPEGRWCSRCIVIHIASVEQERDRLKEAMKITDANLTAAMKEVFGRNLKVASLTLQLQVRDEALSAAKKLRLCFPDTVKAAKFDIPRYIIDEFDEKLKAVEEIKENG